jgi:hypothetical protein
MCAPQAVHVLVEIHHLEPIELRRHLLDLLCLARLYNLDTLSIPLDVLARRRLVLPTSLDGATRDLSVVDILNLVVSDRTCNDISRTHACCFALFQYNIQTCEFCTERPFLALTPDLNKSHHLRRSPAARNSFRVAGFQVGDLEMLYITHGGVRGS